MQKIVVIDTETGGLDYRNDSLLSLAAVRVDEDGEIAGSREWYVLEDPLHLNKRAWETNRIPLDVYYTQAKTPLIVLRELDQFIYDWRVEKGRAIPAGHNVKFDLDWLKRLEALAVKQQGNAGNDWKALGWINRTLTYHSIDSASLMRLLYMGGHTKEYLTSLTHCCDYFGIPLGDAAHGALADAEACAKLIAHAVRLTRVDR